LWESRRRRLFLARDRLGVKPLFYSATAEGLIFASELRALRRLASHSFSADPQAVYDFFTFRYVPAPHTLYRDVFKLPAGHYLQADSAGVQTKCYWDVPVLPERACPAESLAEEATACLREAIRLRLIADVPLGVFLSGGTDSSAIVALMTELGAAPVRTFSAGFAEPGYSELPFARQVASRYATEHQEVIVTADDMARELPRLISLRQEPVAEPTDVALYLLSRLASANVKVVLAGEGGDELFAGYPKYAADRLAGFVSALPRPLTQAIEALLPYSQRRARLALDALSLRDEAERTAAWFASFSREESEELFTGEFLDQVDANHPATVFAETLQKDSRRSRLKRMLYADLKIWLPDNLLLRGDHMTMAASIEERVPFLDHKLVELAATIPDRRLAALGRTKLFCRRMFQKYLPPEILHRKKVGFTVPVGLWFKGPLKPMAADLLLASPARSQSYFDAANVRRIVNEHLTGRRDRRKQLWALVNFELWRQQQAEG
ncbi:MAG: asparagine synthase (glutamine-hydrolyzing), partial [Terriglobia bacterium]